MLHSEIIIDKKYPGFNPVQFGYEQCSPSWAYGPAVRPYWLLHYVVSGSGIFERDGVIHKVTPGDIFVIPPFLETFYQADHNDPWYYIWIGFEADCLPDNVLSRAIIRKPGAGTIFMEMRRCSEKENGKSAFLSSKIWELTALLLENDTVVSNHIDKALSYMNAEYANGISVNDVARKLNLDRTYFSVLFKNSIGTCPIAYLTELRMRKAAELMTKYGQTPSIAAMSVGYFTYSHFSKAFKRHFGRSPRNYAEYMRR